MKIMDFSLCENGKDQWLVFIHGMGAGSEIWDQQIEALGEEYNIMSVDLYSHGRSLELLSDLKVDSHLGHMAQRIASKVKEIGEQRCHLVGFSLGTLIIKYMVVNRLVAPASVVMCGAIERLNLLVRVGYRFVSGLSYVLPYRWLAKVALFVVLPFFDQHNIRQLFFAYSWQKREFPAWMKLYGEHRELLRHNAAFFNSSIPKLYILGTRDYLFAPAVRRELKKHPSVKPCEIQGSGHAIMLERPGETTSLIHGFVAGRKAVSKAQ